MSADVRDFVSVEPSERGGTFHVVAWTANGGRVIVSEHRSAKDALAITESLHRALATWDGWADPHLEAPLDQLR